MTLYEDILGQLYAIDPALKEHEQDLIPVIELLVKKRPDRKPNKKFVQELRRQLKLQAEELSSSSAPQTFFSTLTMNPLPILASFAFGVVITAPITYQFLQAPSAPTPQNGMQMQDEKSPQRTPEMLDNETLQLEAKGRGEDSMFAYSVTDAMPNAFGKLTQPEESMPATEATGLGGGGGDGMPEPAPTAISRSTKLAPFMVRYAFNYSGDAIDLPESTVSVLKRTMPSNQPLSNSTIQSLLSGFFAPESFPNLAPENISLIQDRKNGYSINAQVQMGVFSISQNWRQWENPLRNCQSQECYERNQLTQKDMISDEEAIGLASTFLEQHGIDYAHYGAPIVQHEDNRVFAARDTVFVPETIDVLYPLEIDGQTVYEQHGQPHGMHVNISLRHKAVSGVWNITTQHYEQSAYDAVRDEETLFAYMESQRNPRGMEPPDGIEQKEIAVALGTPERGYTVIYDYETSSSLLVPALLFPVTSVTGDDEQAVFLEKVIPVPLAKDAMEQLIPTPELLR